MSFKGTDQGSQVHFHLEDANMDTLIRIARGLGEKVTGVVEGPDWTTDGEARINAQEGLITTILARLSEIVTEMKEVNLISATPSDDSAQSPDTCGPCHTISDAHRRLDLLEATVAEMRAEADNCEAGMTGNEGNQPSSPETVQSGMTREVCQFPQRFSHVHPSGISVGCRRLDWQRIAAGFSLRWHVALHECRCAALLHHLDFSECW